MVKAKRKTLPKDFEQMLSAGDLQALKAVFDNCDLEAYGGLSKKTALAFVNCPDELTRWLVAQGANLSAVDMYGETPLHQRAGHWTGQVELLIELGADVNHTAGGKGTPLHRAAAVGNLHSARSLLDHGARPDALNRNGQTPLVLALEQCSNPKIQRIAAMAELLLDAMRNTPPEPVPLLRRLFAKVSKPDSPVTPQMQSLVQRIGTDFEFHRVGYNPESVDATSDALDRLYTLFDVAPVPRRTVHDGKSPIVAKAARWEDRHQELWELLVPSSGPATTAQGEAIRISGRIHTELEDNGGVNWDSDYRKMVDALLAHLNSGQALQGPELDAARQVAAEVRAGGSSPAEMCRFSVKWVDLNPQPIALSGVAYKR